MWIEKMKVGVLGASVLALAACSSTPLSGNNAPVANTSAGYNTAASTATGYGVVQSIDVVSRQEARNNGINLGTVAGALVGGVLGSQVGGGSGKTAATIAGTAGGALAGNAIQNNAGGGAASSQAYRVSIRMDNGSMQNIYTASAPAVQVGERVRLENGTVVERFR